MSDRTLILVKPDGVKRGLTGQILARIEAKGYTIAKLQQLQALMMTVAQGYLAEGKRFATIAIGCTGGKHRSTAMAEELGRRLREIGMPTKVLHRDLGRE